MPETDHQKPRRTGPEDAPRAPNPRAEFVELGLATCFSFLRGASDAVDLVAAAHAAGYDAIGCADLNSLAGVVRLHVEARKAALRPVTGCRLRLVSGQEFLAYPTDREAYGRLSRLLSKGKRHDPDGTWQAKGICDITLDDLAAHAQGLRLILVPPRDLRGFDKTLPGLVRRLPGLGYIAASHLYRGDDRARINRLDRLATAAWPVDPGHQ